MGLIYFYPVLAGCAMVLQNGVNLFTSKDTGLAWVLFINSVVAGGFALVLMKWGPGVFLSKGPLQISPLHFLSGLCGLTIISLVPLAFEKIGAGTSIAILIASQSVFAILWDVFVLKAELPNFIKLSGMLLCMAGAIMVAKS